jgi:iron complex outermembrane receptor protein
MVIMQKARRSINYCVLRRLTATIACGFAAALPGAVAASGIQEVIVTAQKRAENLQETPIAISTLSAEQLQVQGITSFEGVAKASPSITFTPYPVSSNLLILYMRGQGVSDPAQITSDGSVGLYEDGFYISRPQAATFDLADLERVEVLRGPQGTLYGRNTTGGAVNLISRKPSGEFDFRQSLTFGDRDRFRSLTVVDLPEWHDIATKLSLLKSSKDGYVKNTGNAHDFGEESQLAGRLAVHWNAAPAVTVDYFMEKGSLDSTPGYYQNDAWSGRNIAFDGNTYPYHTDGGRPQSHTYRPVDLNLSTSDFEGHGLTLAWDVSDALTIKSLTGYRELTWRAYQDFVEAFAFITSTDPTFPLQPLPVSLITDTGVTSHQFSQELQFIGNAGERIKYIAGLYYFSEGSSATAVGMQAAAGTVLNKFRYVSADAESKAAYAQATWTPPILDDKLDFTLGARYTRDRREAERTNAENGVYFERGSATGTDNDDDFSKFNPMFTVGYAWSDDVSSYAKVATGYKAGGSSESGPIGEFDQTFDPENVTTYELGLKSFAWEQRIRANIALFESRFDDMQLAFATDPGDAGIVQSYNAGKATVRGVELDLLIQPTDDFSANLEYAYLDPEIDKVEALAGTIFDPAVNPAIAGIYSTGDNIKDLFALPYAPRNSVNVGMDYTLLHFSSAALAAHLDYQFRSKVFATATAGPDVKGRENVELPSYGILNGRLTLAVDLPRGDNVKISLWGKNLADKEYLIQANGMGSAIPVVNQVNQVIDAYVQSSQIWAEPASYGIDISYQY